MVKQSFIGDMWKTAVVIKNKHMDSKECNETEIITLYVNNKFSYFIFDHYNVLNGGRMMPFTDKQLRGIATLCENCEMSFNVRCRFVINSSGIENSSCIESVVGFLVQ